MQILTLQPNIIGWILFLIFAVIPAYFINRFLLKLIRPKESWWRLLAHIVIILAAAIVYSSLIVLILVKFLFPVPQ